MKLSDASGFYLGAQAVGAIYLGAALVWSSAPPPSGDQLAEFSAIYARAGEPFWRTIGYFPPVLSGSGTLNLAELHAASLYF
jgi:hypothetical protein